MKECHEVACNHGFWEGGGLRNKGEMIALMHSELSEMLEAIREPKQDHHCPEFTNETVEAADLLIRVFDYCQGWNLPLCEALSAKIAYNQNRPHKHGKAF